MHNQGQSGYIQCNAMTSDRYQTVQTKIRLKITFMTKEKCQELKWTNVNKNNINWQSNPINVKKNIYEETSEWARKCCLTSTEQFYSYVIAITSYIQLDDDEDLFLVDQHS